MTLEEAFKTAEASAEKWWNHVPENSVYFKKWEFFRDMMQDLRAIGRTDEQIWHEFITGAFMDGFLEAKKGEIEYESICKDK